MPLDNTVTQTIYAKEFNAKFQVEQSYLRGMVYTKGEIKGDKYIFIISGTVTPAVKRASNGDIPYIADGQSSAQCTLEEYFGEPKKKTKFNIWAAGPDQRAQMQLDSTISLNQRIDDLILAEMANTTVNTGAAAAATLNTCLAACKLLDDSDAPDDGQRFGLLSAAAWAQMMKVNQWTSRDWVDDTPFMKKVQWRFWNGVWWARYTRLSGKGTNSCKMYIWHKNAIGHGIGQELKSKVGYNEENEYSWAHSAIDMGAKLIQTNGVVQWIHDDTAAI